LLEFEIAPNHKPKGHTLKTTSTHHFIATALFFVLAFSSTIASAADFTGTQGAGQGVVVFYGLAKPVRTPLIGPVQQSLSE
jgi:hypothetical protein